MKLREFAGQSSVIFTTYDDENFYGFVKRRIFDFEELLASLGGFMGLIGGLSVISVIEIFYFIFLHRIKSSNIEERQDNEIFLKKIFVSFGNSSSIHGMNHVSDKSRSNFEK